MRGSASKARALRMIAARIQRSESDRRITRRRVAVNPGTLPYPECRVRRHKGWRMSSTDSDWLAGARRLDRQVLAEVYDSLSPALYRYALRLLGESQAAEDIVAETFHRLLVALRARAGPRQHLRAYLYRVAHNLAMDRHRRRAAKPEEVSFDDLCAADGEDPAGSAEQRWLEGRAREALWNLTADQRQVIVLKYLEGLNNEEVAAALDKPVGAVKSLQHRALESLRRMLSPEQEREEGAG
jgi:RNA polymerase sigma-70 factor (ECF subfamily)